MTQFKGFTTRKEAQDFLRDRGNGTLCGKNGPNKQDWLDCVLFGGLDTYLYPYAVLWNISQM